MLHLVDSGDTSLIQLVADSYRTSGTELLMEKTKVAIVHLLPAPYRLPLFERLLRDTTLEVRLFFTDRQASNRPTWFVGTIPSDWRVVLLPEIAIRVFEKRGDVLRVNIGLSRIFRWKPDVVLLYGHNEPTSILVALMCIAKGVPYALFAEVSNSARWSLLRKATAILMSILVRRAAVLVPASESCRSFYSRLGGRADRMALIPCVPDTERLRTKSRELVDSRCELRRNAGLSDRFVVLFVGRLVEHKGIRDIMQAVAEIRDKDPNVVVLFAGYGPLDDYVKAECAKIPENAKYIGFVNDDRLFELYSIADLHIMPSWDEPYGVVCAEALAFGVPSVVADTAGCVDLIKHGHNGFVIPPMSPLAIAECVLAVSTDPALHAEMKVNARTALVGLDMDHMYAKLKEVITRARRNDG